MTTKAPNNEAENTRGNGDPSVADAEIDLDRDVFLRRLLRSLAGTLEETVGLDQAEGFISVVGQEIGERIDADYRESLGADRLDPERVAQVLVDLKRRIQGDFYVIEQDEDRIVLGNRRCPFGDYVKDRPSLCMMTSNVFGTIAARNAGFARVKIDKAIARGDAGCVVVVSLKPSDPPSGEARDYYAS